MRLVNAGRLGVGGTSTQAKYCNPPTTKGREAPTVIDMVANITCPVVGFFGNDDGNPSPEDVDRLDAELSKHGIAHSFHRYDGAGHAFQNFLNEANYRESQAEDAWGKVIDFFGEALALRSRRLVTKTSSTSPS